MENMKNTPSKTPLKRYRLHCPVCGGENIRIWLDMPEKPGCGDCEDYIDLDLVKFVGHDNWDDYLMDRVALLLDEKKQNDR